MASPRGASKKAYGKFTLRTHVYRAQIISVTQKHTEHTDVLHNMYVTYSATVRSQSKTLMEKEKQAKKGIFVIRL